MTEIALQMGMPSCELSEQLLLGMMIDQKIEPSMIFSLIQPEHFHSSRHQSIARTIQGLERDGMMTDRVLLAETMLAERTLEGVGGMSYLIDLGGLNWDTRYDQHCGKVLASHIARQLIEKTQAMLTRALDGGSSPLALIQSQTEALAALQGEYDRVRESPLKGMADICREEGFSTMQEWLRHGSAPMVPIPFASMRDSLDGFRAGELVIIGARPGQGKTAMACRMIEECAEHEIGTAFFSLEMDARQIAIRFASSLSRLSPKRIRLGDAAEHPLSFMEQDRLDVALAKIQQWCTFLCDKSMATVPSIRAAAHRMVSKGTVKAIIIDYLGLIKNPNKTENRANYVAEISRELKRLAMELSVPVIALHQVNRQAEQSNEAPLLSQLKDSGSIEQDADIVLMIHQHKSDPQEAISLVDFMIAKQRNGPAGFSHTLNFVKKFARFEEDGRAA